MTNSVAPAHGTRERLVAAACELVYRRGVERTTLAEVAQEANVRVGNLYYYFKTKDDLLAAVVRERVDRLAAAFTALERAHRSPKARLKALVRTVAEREAGSIAELGCPYGTLCTELVKRVDGVQPLAAQVMQVLLEWAEEQF